MPYISKRRISPKTDRKEANDRRNDKWSKYYGSVAWKHLRHWYITNHPLCEQCLFEGRSTPAEEVHHRIPFAWFLSKDDRMKALLYPEFLMSLCKECHLKIHQSLKRPDNFEQTKEYKIIHDSY